jgi:hypothetical protein
VSKFETLTNVCCEGTVNFRSQLQECTAQQEDHVEDVTKK